MPFCSNCGAPVVEGAKFCARCGAKLIPAAAPTQAPAAPQAPVAPQAPAAYQTPAAPQTAKDFSRITVRYLCPNRHVFDGSEHETVCRTCGAPLPKGGYIQMYRMGNYMGVAVGMGIYINDVPCGHIGNKQSLRINVPFGSHKVHVTHTTTRKCNDPVFTVTPEAPVVWCKAHFSKAGFAITVEPASPDTMPEV